MIGPDEREASGLGWREEFRDFALSIALLPKRSLRRGSDTALKLTVATKGRALDATTRKIVWLREGVPASYQHYVSESHQKIPTGWRAWRTHFLDYRNRPCDFSVSYPRVSDCQAMLILRILVERSPRAGTFCAEAGTRILR